MNKVLLSAVMLVIGAGLAVLVVVQFPSLVNSSNDAVNEEANIVKNVNNTVTTKEVLGATIPGTWSVATAESPSYATKKSIETGIVSGRMSDVPVMLAGDNAVCFFGGCDLAAIEVYYAKTSEAKDAIEELKGTTTTTSGTWSTSVVVGVSSDVWTSTDTGGKYPGRMVYFVPVNSEYYVIISSLCSQDVREEFLNTLQKDALNAL